MNKFKRKVSIFILVVLVCCAASLLLVSCDNSTKNTVDKYATFYYQNEAALEPTAQKIDTSDFRKDATIEDVFKFAEYKYDFGAILKEEEEGISLNALVNKGINPNKLQEIEIYTDDEESKDKNKDVRIDFFGSSLYKTNSILSTIKLKAGKNYVFQVKSEYKKPIFEKDFSNKENIHSNVTEPVIDGNFLFIVVDNYLVKLDKNGKEIGHVKLEKNTYYGGMFSPCIVGENIVCGLMGGIVQAINKETLEITWTYKHSRIIAAQENVIYDVASPIVFDKDTNTIFVGMYANDVLKNEKVEAEMLAIDATNGKLKSYTSSKEGYYFISPIIIKDAFISSKMDKDGQPYIVAYDKTNLAIEFDKIKTKGIVKSSFEYLESENGLFFTSLEKGVTYINRIWFDEETNKFGQNCFSEKTASKYSHGQPAIYKNRMYVTSADHSFASTEGYLQVFDIKSMKEIYRVKTGALNSASFYIKPVTHNKQEEVFVFFTLNKKESGLHYIVDKSNAISGIMYTAHMPENQNNSMSHIVVDQDGSMYYKNDSNIITKIDKGYFSE